MTAIKIKDLSYTYSGWGQQTEALKNISFDIEQGEFVVIAGPNGSGKSTLLSILSGMKNNYNGDVFINDKNIKTLIKQKHLFEHVYYMPQNILKGCAPLLTVFENLFVSDLSISSMSKERKGRKFLEKKYMEIIESLGGDFGLNQTADTLSGGQRQLLSLAIAYIRSTDIILLDEPTASLDPEKTKTAETVMEKLKKENRTLVLVTHNKQQAISKGDRTIGISNGKIVYNKQMFDRNSDNVGVIWE